MLADDIGRGFHPVNAGPGQHAEVVDKVAATIGELYQLLRGLQRIAGGQLAEHGDHGLVHIDLGKQLLCCGFIQHIGGGRHGWLRYGLNN